MPYLWYRCDEGDSDLATFFYYIGLAAWKALPRYKKPLPLLRPEYLAGIAEFTRRYFEELYRRLTPPHSLYLSKRGMEGVMVLDNYQDVPADSPFHDMITNGFDAIPEGVHAVVISRGAPPSASARLQANNKISLLEYRDIRFTFDESRDLVHGRIPKADESFIKAMYEKTEGWAAGIILMLAKARLRGTAPEPAVDLGYDRVFDYFAEEIFNRTERALQEFLLKTAFLPVLSVPLVEKLTGINDAGRMLSALHRHHYFTEKLSGNGQDYQYHPLFRDFLLNRVKTRSTPDHSAAMQRHAAVLLEGSGQIEEAARLYGNAGDREGLVRMIIGHARELLSQGRNKTVQEWIAAIPGGLVNDHPWLLYWTGMCSFPFDMVRARKYLEEALAAFKAKKDPSGLYLSWAGIVDTYAFELDRWKRLDAWIATFERLQKAYPSFPSKEIGLIASSRMLICLTLRKTDRPKWVQTWLERVSVLLQENPSFDIQMDTIFSVSLYSLWKGDYQQNALLLERAEAEIRHHRPSPFAVIRIKLMKGIHYWVTAQYDSALNTLSEGLDISEKNGIHVFDSLLWSFKAAAQMAPGNLELAETSLKNQIAALLEAPNTLDTFFYHLNAAWYAILNGNVSLAAEHMEIISAKATRMGTPYYLALWNIGMAQVTLLQDRVRNAKAHIQAAHRISLRMKSHVMEWFSLFISAYMFLKEGKENEGLALLRRSLSLGRKHDYVHLEFYQPSVMRFLCAKALEKGIEVDYVKGLIRKLGLTPPDDSAASVYSFATWPYPVRINTLGEFEIVLNGKPVGFSRKVPKKPLELLKALIAFGGQNVSMEKISDTVWPDADGDAAYQSFKVHLHHLRRLLGSEEAVLTREGRISLNLQYCHLDVQAFEHAVSKILELGAEAGKAERKEFLPLCRKAIHLYRGNFLADDEGYPHFAALRERLRSKFSRLVERTGRYYEARKQWLDAAEIYEKGLEIDEFQEEFYKRLMVCYGKLARTRQVASVYDRCRRMLNLHFGVEPSSGMNVLYEKLMLS